MDTGRPAYPLQNPSNEIEVVPVECTLSPACVAKQLRAINSLMAFNVD